MVPESFHAHTLTCCQALTLLLCGENLCVSQTAVSNIPDAEAEHGMREEELGHCGECGLAFVKILPQLHHIQNLVKERQRQVRPGVKWDCSVQTKKIQRKCEKGAQ